ncbi:MAG: CPXCG motif-containing cysteine-rich protein [Halobacteriovoraceae bacterium]|nr:CPXCG motif-containing cysteine-rich protein [Halobacteriovoraceae bacterium]
MQGEKEYHFQCPYCFSPISMVFEIYYGEQTYIEDCEVCCNPIEVHYTCDGEEITSFEAQRL